MIKFPRRSLLNFLLRVEMPELHKECPMRLQPLLLELTQLCLLKLKLRLRPKPKLKLVPELLPLPLPLLQLLLKQLLALMLQPTKVHNTLLNRNLMEVSLSMFLNKDQVLNAKLARPQKSNIPVLSQLTVKFSILQSQEVSQLPSPLVK